MRQELCIYPLKCSQQCDVLKNSAAEVLAYKSRLESVKMTLAGLSGSGYSNVVSFLDSIIANVETEKNNLKTLENVLNQSIQLYVQTENNITWTKASVNQISCQRNGIDDKFADILSFISEIRGSFLGMMLESLALCGIFVDYAIKDLSKILSGTYLSSHWKNGQLYLNLNYDNLTNRQAIEWLEENLGGGWDNYLARNMKRDGFAIFDMDDGFLRDMKYFDDITDTELINYFDTLKNIEHLSFPEAFTTTFKNNFNLLDDFNYKEFSNWGKLGKAGKILGTAGTVFTIGGDVTDNFYDAKTGAWSFSSSQLADCVLDVGIDIGTGAGSAAAGAAIGSFFVPPVGTVVGAGVGFAIDFAANNINIVDIDGDGEKDSVIDIAKYGAHQLVDMGEDALDAALDWGSDAISDVSGWFSEAFAF